MEDRDNDYRAALQKTMKLDPSSTIGKQAAVLLAE